jgi:chemotaxis protein MotB
MSTSTPPENSQPTGNPDRGRPGLSLAVLSLAAFLLAGSAVALGFYGYRLWSGGRDAQASLDHAQRELDRLRRENKTTLTALERQTKDKDSLVQEMSGKVRELGGELAAAQSRLAELNEERAEIASRLAEFRRMTEQFRGMIDSGRLEVSFRRGRMIVELPAQVLFPSGSAELTDEGRAAIGEVAAILRDMRDQHFIVGGHTDTQPISNDRFGSNWGLSASRAVNVTEELIKAGLRPEQLVAAGYAEFDPVAPNAKQAGRQKNRRIEIILEPKLRGLPELKDLEATK